MRRLSDVLALLHRGRSPAAGLDDADLRTVLGFTADVLADLARLHGRGLAHGDVCPGAIRIRRRARLLHDEGVRAPREYRDPDRERALIRDPGAARRVEPGHDLYGVGATLFALLDGGPPECGPTSPFTRPVPHAVAYVVYRAMAEGSARYPSAKAMARDLRALLRRGGRGSFVAVEPESLPSHEGGRVPRPVALRPYRRPPARPRHRAPLALAILLLVALGGIAATHKSKGPEIHARPPAPARRPGLAGQVDEWRERLDGRLRAVGSRLDTLDVPLLVVSDTPVTADLQWPRHPSESLAGAIRRALDEDPSPDAVQAALLAAVGPDTLPAVLRVQKGGGSLRASFYYRKLHWEAVVPSR